MVPDVADGNRPVIPEIRIGVPLVEDFARIARNLRPDEIEQFVAFTGAPGYKPDVLARTLLATPGTSYVLVDRTNLPIAIGGFEPLRPGVWQTWGIGTLDGWAKHWRAITKQSRRQMDYLFANGAHRIEIIALVSRHDAHRWYEEGLLMQCEGTLKGYCANGADAVMYARTMEKWS